MPNQLHPSLNRDSVRLMRTAQHRGAVAAEVRAALARDGRTAAALAEGSGISKSALSRKMRGLAPIYVEELVAIATTLGIDSGALIPTSHRERSTETQAA